MRILAILLILLLPATVYCWTNAKGYSDAAAPVRVYIPAASCSVSTAAQNWDLYSLTDPTPACITGTVLKKGILTFAEAGTVCTSTTATTGCAFTTFQLPGDFPSAARIDAKLLFTSTDVTLGHTVIWNIATKCTTPTTGGTGSTDNPAAMNTGQVLTYTVGASEVADSLRQVSQTSVTTTGCTGGDLFHIRVGRDKTTDTATTDVNFVGLELTIYNSV
jgi:hypothetical protein